MEITKSHMALTNSLGAQEDAQQRLLHSLEMASFNANTTFERLLGMFGTLSQSLDDVDVKIRSWNGNVMGQTWMPLGALIFGFGILLGREGGGILSILVGASGSYRLVPSSYYSALTACHFGWNSWRNSLFCWISLLQRFRWDT